MAKTPKKRNKQYRGEDAAVSNTPNIHRYTAVERNRLSQWWHEKKRIVKPISIGIAIVVIFVWLVAEALRLIF